jgi:hypothetical protein
VIASQVESPQGSTIAFSETRGINAYCCHSKYTETDEVILFANNDGYVYQMESGNSFDGDNIYATFSTSHLPISDPSTRKTLFKATLFTDPSGAFSVKMTPRYDYAVTGSVQPGEVTFANAASAAKYYGTATYGDASYSGNLKYMFESNLTGSGKVVQFQFTSDSTDPPFSLDTLIIQYGQYGRR